MRAIRHVESHEHARRAMREEDRAIRQASKGHVVRAAHLEHKSNEQKVMAVATSNHPAMMATALHPHPPVGVAVGAAVVATEVREAEMIAAATHERYYPPAPTVVVVKEPVYYPGAPVPGYNAYPGMQVGYPPAEYPPYGYPR